MRHQHKGFKLGRTATHRKATLSAMSTALIKHKRITTTHAKAKALRMFVEPLINRAKEDTTHNRRQVFRRLQDKHAVTELFGDVAERVGTRSGGYTRIVKIGQRAGDAAPMAIIELVDYNDIKPEGGRGGRRKTRRSRSRRGSGKAAAGAAATAGAAVDEAADAVTDAAEEAVDAVEAAAEEAAEDVADVVDEVTEDAEEAAEAAQETVAEATAEADGDDADDADAGDSADEDDEQDEDKSA